MENDATPVRESAASRSSPSSNAMSRTSEWTLPSRFTRTERQTRDGSEETTIIEGIGCDVLLDYLASLKDAPASVTLDDGRVVVRALTATPDACETSMILRPAQAYGQRWARGDGCASTIAASLAVAQGGGTVTMRAVPGGVHTLASTRDGTARFERVWPDSADGAETAEVTLCDSESDRTAAVALDVDQMAKGLSSLFGTVGDEVLAVSVRREAAGAWMSVAPRNDPGRCRLHFVSLSAADRLGWEHGDLLFGGAQLAAFFEHLLAPVAADPGTADRDLMDQDAGLLEDAESKPLAPATVSLFLHPGRIEGLRRPVEAAEVRCALATYRPDGEEMSSSRTSGRTASDRPFRPSDSGRRPLQDPPPSALRDLPSAFTRSSDRNAAFVTFRAGAREPPAAGRLSTGSETDLLVSLLTEDWQPIVFNGV